MVAIELNDAIILWFAQQAEVEIARSAAPSHRVRIATFITVPIANFITVPFSIARPLVPSIDIIRYYHCVSKRTFRFVRMFMELIERIPTNWANILNIRIDLLERKPW